jgi:subtilisin family serine protease
MRKKIKLIKLLLFVFIGLNAQTPYFYYYGGERQYLELDTKYVFVSVADENTADRAFTTHNAKYEPLRIDIPEGNRSRTNQNKRFWSVLSLEDRLSGEAYLAKLVEIKNTEEDLIVAPYFKNQYQDKIGLSNFFFVKLKELNDTILLKQEAEKEHVLIMWQNEFMPLWFALSVTKNTKYNAMELSNRFYESGLFQYAEPDLMVDALIECANDQHFGQQWGLENTGQSGGMSGIDIKICNAWQISTGNNVIVAVVDNGVNLTHSDLSPNIYSLSWDSESGTSPQKTIPGDHGTFCAGIIGAARNNVVGGITIGIAGVAPNCKIMSISNSLQANIASWEARANGINWAWKNGASVISNSWGSSVVTQKITEAIDSAVIRGRNGLGCVVVKSSGNGNSTTVTFPGAHPWVITVGAINRNGQRLVSSSTSGSNYGNDLNVVAPGVDTWSTNLNGNYTYSFGTSYAAPHVSGIAALILSVNPNLKERHVREIIESTSQALSGYPPNNPSRPNWNNQVGYGLVNAYAAVQKATACATTTVNFTNQIVTTNTTVTSCGNINVQNVKVQNGAKLILDAWGEVNIISDFEVDLGSEFEIKY